MSFLGSIGSLFAPNISGPITSGLTTGYNLAAPELQQWLQGIQQLYPQAISTVQQGTQQALPFMRKLYGVGQAGTQQLENLLGIGPQGGAGVQQTLRNLPGFNFTLNSAIDAANRGAEAGGTFASGGQEAALANLGSNIGQNFYSNYVSQLNPFLNTLAQGATGTANTILGGAGSVSNLLTGQAGAQGGPLSALANLGWGLGTGIGSAGAQQNVANTNYGLGVLGGLGNLFGGMFSDERLKRDIEPVGETYDGLGIFKYKYLWDDTPRIGLMAQDVERVVPEAVGEVGGFKTVNYDRATSRAAELARLLQAAA